MIHHVAFRPLLSRVCREGAGEAVPGAVAEEKMSLVEEGNSAAPQKPGGGKKGKRDRKKKAVDDDWLDLTKYFTVCSRCVL